METIALIEVDSSQFTTAADVVARAVCLARCEGDLSGPEADTLAALMAALMAKGCTAFTVEIIGGGDL